MTQIADFPLDANFAGTYLQANGTSISGNSALDGIAGRIEIVDNAARLTVYGADPETDFGHRAAVRFGTFPNSGECWSSVDFMIDPLWTTNGVATIGSWYPSPDEGEELIVKHVNIGLRLVNRDTLFVNVPAITLPAVTANGETVAITKIEQGVWHNVTIRMNLQTTTTGWREVYLNRVKIYGEYNIPTAYDDANGPWYKMEARTLVQDYDMVRMWVRNAKQWTGNESFTTTMGGAPTSRHQLIGV